MVEPLFLRVSVTLSYPTLTGVQACYPFWRSVFLSWLSLHGSSCSSLPAETSPLA